MEENNSIESFHWKNILPGRNWVVSSIRAFSNNFNQSYSYPEYLNDESKIPSHHWLALTVFWKSNFWSLASQAITLLPKHTCRLGWPIRKPYLHDFELEPECSQPILLPWSISGEIEGPLRQKSVSLLVNSKDNSLNIKLVRSQIIKLWLLFVIIIF